MKPILLEEVLTPSRISAALEKLRRNDGASGEDAITIRELDESFPSLWPATESAILAGTYTPAPLRPVSIPKPSGGTRKLAIPSVLDRLVQHAIASTLGARWEPRFPTSSFAYRPGIGPRDAIDAVLSHAGCLPRPTALRLDIRDFFDRIPPAAIDRILRDTPCDPAVSRLIHTSLATPMAGPLGPVPRPLGIPQGSPLSPLLSNAVLLPFDHALSSSGIPLFRYADDMLLLCPDETSARHLHFLAIETLAPLGLELNNTKTRLLPLHGATFLGTGFRHDGHHWHRALSPDTKAACIQHLRRMEDSGRSPAEMTAFLRQWAASFLPCAADIAHHDADLGEIAGLFRLRPLPPPSGGSRHRPPPGFAYDGCRSHPDHPRLPWALRFLFRRVRFGLHFRRKGFLPVPSGIHITIAGHRIHLRF